MAEIDLLAVNTALRRPMRAEVERVRKNARDEVLHTLRDARRDEFQAVNRQMAAYKRCAAPTAIPVYNHVHGHSDESRS